MRSRTPNPWDTCYLDDKEHKQLEALVERDQPPCMSICATIFGTEMQYVSL